VKTLVLANQKGGVGKSAIATLFAQHQARLGRRVLAIDLDHQGNLSRPLGKSGKAVVSAITSDQLLTGKATALEGTDAFVLIPAGNGLQGLERQPRRHGAFIAHLRRFLHSVDDRFDVCVIDTNPNPDIRVVAALACADHVLSPIQLNQESRDGIAKFLLDSRVGLVFIQAALNPRLRFLGLLPNLVEPTPFQRANQAQLLATDAYRERLLALVDPPSAEEHYARIPKRSAVAEAQAAGALLWERKDKTAWRDAWAEIRPVMDRIGELMELDHGPPAARDTGEQERPAAALAPQAQRPLGKLPAA
jgi:chromosome partitioning protein